MRVSQSNIGPCLLPSRSRGAQPLDLTLGLMRCNPAPIEGGHSCRLTMMRPNASE